MLDAGVQVDFVLTAAKDCHAMSTFKEALNNVGPRRATATDDESAQFRGQRFSPDARSIRSTTPWAPAGSDFRKEYREGTRKGYLISRCGPLG
jgi:hypothetical protein